MTPSEEETVDDSCCAPGRTSAEAGATADDGDTPPATTGGDEVAPAAVAAHDFVRIDGGAFVMGTDEPYAFAGDGEGPAREVVVAPFRMARHAVTNEQFAAFVDATGYRTEAERFGWSFVFHLLLPDEFPETRAVAAAPWWRQVYGADWAHPEGPHADVEDRRDHPAVHITWNDATAYCSWAGVRLPTEAEWEKAARGGIVQARFAWGQEFRPGGRTMCNIFEGTFPTENTGDDGWIGTSPVGAFPPNGYGLHDVAGNVWEWCADWFDTDFHRSGPRVDPVGPPGGQARVMRGGSYLCHDSYCDRYRVSARSSNTPDSSTGNLGFRVAADA